MTTSSIKIGDNVWLGGAKSTILSGVEIGCNSVIGANAVVNRDYRLPPPLPSGVQRRSTNPWISRLPNLMRIDDVKAKSN